MTDETPTTEVVDVEGEEVTPTVADLTPARIDHGALVTAAAPKAAIVAAFREYADLVETVVDKKDDYQRIGDKSFMKKAGLRKLAVVFGVSYRILDRVHERDELGRIVRSEFTVEAIAPNGRFMDGYGACSIWDRCKAHYPDCRTEVDPDKPKAKLCDKHCGGREGGCDGFSHFSKPEHDVPATAETRAKNRAGADLFAMGQVSAEEVDSQEAEHRWPGAAEIRALIDLCKDVKAAGGDPGTWPVVLGTTVMGKETDVGDDGTPVERTVPLIRMDVFDGLVSQLERTLAALTKPAGEGSAAAAQTDQADATATEPEPEDQIPSTAEAPAPEEAPSPAESPDEIEEAELVEEPAGDVAPTAPGDDEPQESAGAAVEPTTPAAPAPPAPTAEEPATKGEKAALATKAKAFYGDEKGPLARHALCRIVTAGRTSTSTQLTGKEIRYAISALRLLTTGHLAFVVGRGEGREVLDVGDVPGEEDACSLSSATPEGEDGERGRAFITELAAYLRGEVQEAVSE